MKRCRAVLLKSATGPVWKLLLAAALLAGCVSTAEAARYAIYAHLEHAGGDVASRVEGELDTPANKLQLEFYSYSLKVGSITEAYMTSRTHPVPNEVSLMRFVGPNDNYPYISVRLSDANARQVVAGDWQLIVRSSGFEPAQYAGRAGPCADFNDGRVCTLTWSAIGPDGRHRQELDESDQPFEASLWLDPANDRLCLETKRNELRNERRWATASFSAPDEEGRSAAATAGPSQGCSPATPSLRASFAAGQVQVAVTTAATPADEYVYAFKEAERLPDLRDHNPENTLFALSILCCLAASVACFVFTGNGRRSVWTRLASSALVLIGLLLVEGFVLVRFFAGNIPDLH